MTHFEEYNRIIEERRRSPLPDSEYGENHHIVPRSVCPLLKNASANVVRLSAYEHMMAHYHLWLAYRDELREKAWAKKMCFAFCRMKATFDKTGDVELLARQYAEARREFSELNTGANNYMYGRRRYVSEENRRHLSESKTGAKNPMYGKKQSEESNRKRS